MIDQDAGTKKTTISLARACLAPPASGEHGRESGRRHSGPYPDYFPSPSARGQTKAQESERTRCRRHEILKPATHDGCGNFRADAGPCLIRNDSVSSRFEQDTLSSVPQWLLIRDPSLCARAQDDPGKPYPTFALAMALFEEPAWDAMAPDHPLRSTRLLDVEYSNAQSLTTAAIRADERVISYIKGLNFLDERLSALLTTVDAEGVAGNLPPSQWQQSTGSAPNCVTQGPVLVKLLERHLPRK